MSSQTFEIVLPPETLALIERAKDTPNIMLAAIRRGMEESREPMVSAIRLERLSGVGPFPVSEHRLGQVTSHLRDSVNPSEVRQDGDVLSFSVGTNVEYAAVHEFGFSGQVNVSAHRRNRSVSVTVETIDKHGRSRRRTASSKVAGQVRAHTRRMVMPARAPFGHGAADNVGIITRAITRNLKAMWGGQAS